MTISGILLLVNIAGLDHFWSFDKTECIYIPYLQYLDVHELTNNTCIMSCYIVNQQLFI
jgi:hypothetical protein